MVLADLKQPCSACDGSGFVAGFNQYGTLLANDTRKCKECQGKGYILTKLGKEIWALYEPMIEELIQKIQPLKQPQYPQAEEGS